MRLTIAMRYIVMIYRAHVHLMVTMSSVMRTRNVGSQMLAFDLVSCEYQHSLNLVSLRHDTTESADTELNGCTTNKQYIEIRHGG